MTVPPGSVSNLCHPHPFSLTWFSISSTNSSGSPLSPFISFQSSLNLGLKLPPDSPPPGSPLPVGPLFSAHLYNPMIPAPSPPMPNPTAAPGKLSTPPPANAPVPAPAVVPAAMSVLMHQGFLGRLAHSNN